MTFFCDLPQVFGSLRNLMESVMKRGCWSRRSDQEVPGMILVTNWFEELNRLVPTDGS